VSLEDAHTMELTQRFDFVMEKYVNLAAEIAPKLEEFGKYRRELQLLVSEFERRGVSHNEPESLKKVLEEAMQDVSSEKDGT